jgi:hypothetical protein
MINLEVDSSTLDGALPVLLEIDSKFVFLDVGGLEGAFGLVRQLELCTHLNFNAPTGWMEVPLTLEDHVLLAPILSQ